MGTWQEFYHRFEKQFRGDPETIYSRLHERYHQILENASPKKTALDLACGHGEFLRLLKKCGYTASGVDESYIAVEICRKQGLEVKHGDMLEALSAKETASFDLISLLHVIEHCHPEIVYQCFRQSFRVLREGGILLVETPSLFSLWASTRQFYLDPTHLRPIHPDYICFLAKDSGFKTLQCNEFAAVVHPQRPDEHLIESAVAGEIYREERKTRDWLYGPMDFSCIAFKGETE